MKLFGKDGLLGPSTGRHVKGQPAQPSRPARPGKGRHVTTIQPGPNERQGLWHRK